MGKSTLLLQLAGILSHIPLDEKTPDGSPVAESQDVLYASAEESEEQVAAVLNLAVAFWGSGVAIR